LDAQRNIVPLMLEGVELAAPGVADRLTGKLAMLKRYNALRVPPDYFEDAMERLRQRYLDVALETVLHPPSTLAEAVARTQQAAAKAAPAVQQNVLVAQRWFEEGKARPFSPAAAIECFDRAIAADSGFAEAYKERGRARGSARSSPWATAPPFPLRLPVQADDEIADFSAAIRLRPDDVDAYFWRAGSYEASGDLERAAADYSKIVELSRSDSYAYYRRSKVREAMGDFDGAIADIVAGNRVFGEYSRSAALGILSPDHPARRTHEDSAKIIRDLEKKRGSHLQ
jgi:tetratricopeptide (TPR) repeat protein